MQGKIVTGLIEQLPARGEIHKHADREAWKESRRGRMTGSKAAALFGVSRWLSEYQLFAVEAGLIPEEEIADNGRMRRGRRLEGPILEELAEARGWDVEPWPQTWTIDTPGGEAAKLSCTPDGVAMVRNPLEWEPFEGGEIVNVEVKTIDQWAFRSWEKDADGSLIIPIEYQIQTQIETASLGLNYGVLVLQPSMDLDDMIVVCYEINHAFLSRLIKMAEAFWDRVARKEAPEPDGSDSTWGTLKKMYATENGTAIILPDGADEIADRFEEGKLEEKAGKAKKVKAKNELLALIGEYTFAQTPMGQTYSYKGRTQKRIDSKALRAAMPQVAAEFTKEGEYRVLLPCKSVPQALLQEAIANKPLGEVMEDSDD